MGANEGARRPGRPRRPDSENKTIRRISKYGVEYYVAKNRTGRRVQLPDNTERMQIRLPAGMYGVIKRKATAEGVTAAELVRRIIKGNLQDTRRK